MPQISSKTAAWVLVELAGNVTQTNAEIKKTAQAGFGAVALSSGQCILFMYLP